MKVLVLGNGAREHALVWKLAKSPRIRALYAAPGNPGSAQLAKPVALKLDQPKEILAFAKEEKIDLTVVGPELPLTFGVVDLFRAENLKIIGPTSAAAKLESSKSFAKDVMRAAGVPTAEYITCSSLSEARQALSELGVPRVLKADGLAAGKGVVVCHALSEAEVGLNFLFNELGADKIVIESFLEGREASYIVLADGERFIPLPAAHDYKRIFDRDLGPNTGGMGTVSPTSHLPQEMELEVQAKVILPLLTEMKRRGVPFSGFLYAGLMISPTGNLKVLEFNARMGDPECQVIMRRLDEDLLDIFERLTESTDQKGMVFSPKVSSSSGVCVVLASAGYPGTVELGDEIVGLDFAKTIPTVEIFQAGTKRDDRGNLVTAGGRVLSVTATGLDIAEARQRAYRALDMIQVRGGQVRRDIGED